MFNNYYYRPKKDYMNLCSEIAYTTRQTMDINHTNYIIKSYHLLIKSLLSKSKLTDNNYYPNKKSYVYTMVSSEHHHISCLKMEDYR